MAELVPFLAPGEPPFYLRPEQTHECTIEGQGCVGNRKAGSRSEEAYRNSHTQKRYLYQIPGLELHCIGRKEDTEQQVCGGTDGYGNANLVCSEMKKTTEMVDHGKIDHGDSELGKERCHIEHPKLY